MEKTHYFVNSILVINQRALLYAEICFNKTVKMTFRCAWRAFFFPHNWGWIARGSFLTPSWCWGIAHGSYSTLKVALSYRHWKDPPGRLEKNQAQWPNLSLWQAFKALSALAGRQRGSSAGGWGWSWTLSSEGSRISTLLSYSAA